VSTQQSLYRLALADSLLYRVADYTKPFSSITETARAGPAKIPYPGRFSTICAKNLPG
jgi:hypothetical protein